VRVRVSSPVFCSIVGDGTHQSAEGTWIGVRGRG